MQLGYLPRLRIAHTSAERAGQIYVPWINWMLMAAVLILVFAFESSSKLAFAYGVAVTGTITITSLLFFYVARHRWSWPLWAVLPAAGGFLVVDLLFLSANLTKIGHGAWLPILIGLAAFTVMTTWQRGRELVTALRTGEEGSLREFVGELHERRPPLQRSPGTAVFLNRKSETTPLAMRANVEHNKILHEHAVILSIATMPVPHVGLEERLTIDDLGYSDDGIAHLTASFGYMELPDVPGALRLAVERGLECPLEVDEASYFLSTIDLQLGADPGMPRWRKRLFIATSHITADAAEYFGLPRDRTVIMGSVIEV
jgi:KUP system potassium uptake protein